MTFSTEKPMNSVSISGFWANSVLIQSDYMGKGCSNKNGDMLSDLKSLDHSAPANVNIIKLPVGKHNTVHTSLKKMTPIISNEVVYIGGTATPCFKVDNLPKLLVCTSRLEEVLKAPMVFRRSLANIESPPITISA